MITMISYITNKKFTLYGFWHKKRGNDEQTLTKKTDNLNYSYRLHLWRIGCWNKFICLKRSCELTSSKYFKIDNEIININNRWTESFYRILNLVDACIHVIFDKLEIQSFTY